jgi:hypothetical protein
MLTRPSWCALQRNLDISSFTLDKPTFFISPPISSIQETVSDFGKIVFGTVIGDWFAKEKEEVVTKCDHLSRLKFSPVLPFAYTEHGTIMAASARRRIGF